MREIFFSEFLWYLYINIYSHSLLKSIFVVFNDIGVQNIHPNKVYYLLLMAQIIQQHKTEAKDFDLLENRKNLVVNSTKKYVWKIKKHLRLNCKLFLDNSNSLH